jgi:hypothetical protein
MVGIVAFMGLVIDGGRAYGVRRRAQNAADGAAVAATRDLSAAIQNNKMVNADTPIWMTMVKFAMANGVTSVADVSGNYLTDDKIQVSGVCSNSEDDSVNVGNGGDVNSNYRGVRVHATMRFTPYFISILFGNKPIDVTACATAKFAPINTPVGLQPIIVPLCYVVDDTKKDRALFGQPYSNPLLCGPDPTHNSHVIQGGGPRSGLANYSDFREVINFNDRETLVSQPPFPPPCFSSACTAPSDTPNQNFNPLPSCGDKQGTKIDAMNYIANGGYFGQCGPLFPPSTWLSTFSGDTSGNAGAIQYNRYYHVDQTIYTAVYQECAQEIPDKLPPQCGAFKKASSGGTGCGSFCAVGMIGYAAMRITLVTSNEVDGVWAGPDQIPGDLCLSDCPIQGAYLGVTLVQ